MNTPAILPLEKRITALDVLRGFALLGILLVNMLDFSGSGLRAGTIGTRGNELDQLIDIAIVFLAVTKFYLLFSFLFGVSFAVQMRRMESKNRPFIAFYLRRLLILLLIGIAHAVLIWDGDILRVYAIAGVLLLLVRNWPDRVLLGLAGGLALVAFISLGLTPPQALMAMGSTDSVPLITTGTYVELVAHRLTNPVLHDIQTPMILVMFLLGLVIGRSGVLDEPERYQPFLRRAWKWVLPVALVGNGLLLAGFATGGMWMLSTGIYIGAPLLSFVYAAWVLLYADRLAFLAPAGQMALTNYVTQSLIATTIFYGYGFGLYDRLSPTLTLGVAVAIMGWQLASSRWWMSRFRYGPLEWLWRSLSYGRIEPLGKRPALQPQD